MADLYGTYDKRIKLTAVYTDNITATLTWFPVTVFLTSTQGEEVFVELDADSDFDKVAFTKSDGTTELYADCELYDVSGEVAIYHVSLDGWELSHEANTDFYMYYDDDASANTGKISKSGGTAAQSVYDGDFKAVYHMHDGEPTYDTQYAGSVEPDSDGWTLGGTDYASVSAGILTIDTSANDTYTCYYYKTPDVNFDTGFYLKTRVKASTDMDAASDALIFQIQDGTQNQQFKMWIRDGEVSYFHEPNTTVDIAMDTTTAYVIYEIYIKATTFYIYADGVLKGANTVDAATVTDLVQFGDPLGSPTMCKAEIDYVYYALGVTDNPLLTIYDSTSNNNDGAKKGLGEPVEATGKVGQAQDFAGDDDYINCGDDNTLNIAGNITVEAIVDFTTTQTFVPYVSRWGADNSYVLLNVGDSGSFYIKVSDVNKHADGVNDIDDGNPHYLAGRWDGSNVLLEIDNGVESITGDATGGPIDTPASIDLVLGAYSDTTSPYDGILDEVRISATSRSDAWIAATYESLWDSLLTYGSEETSGVVVDNAIFFGCNF